MAKVGDHELTVEEFMRYVANNPGRVKEATTTAGKAVLLRDAIANLLLLQAAQEQGLVGDSPSAAEAEAAYHRLAEQKFPAPPVPDEKALRRYYADHLQDFGIPAVVRVSQIQIRVPKDATDEERAAARARAEVALARIEKGEPFADVAAELTENPVLKSHRGDAGYLTRQGSDWLEAAVDGLSVGEHTAILNSPVGFDILKLTDEKDAVITPFDEARDEVVKQVQAEGQARAKARYLSQLAEKAGVTVELEELKDAYPEGLFPMPAPESR
jgi:parvulin-like peptidyl-prolyl isomerase